jgi:hypothetical protein
MATTITASTLTVTVTEALTLNGMPIDSTNTLTINSITQMDKRIMSIPTASAVTVLAFSTAVAAGQFISANTKYIRITNKDAVNFVRIRVTKTASQTFDIKLDAGKSFIMGNTSESANIDGGAFSAFVTCDSINAQADTAAVDIEVFIASI